MRTLIFFFILLHASIAYTATITFKDGRTEEFAVIERTDTYIKVDIEGVEIKYYLEDIATIHEERAVREKEKESLSGVTVAIDDRHGVLENEDISVSLRADNGRIIEGVIIEEGPDYIKVVRTGGRSEKLVHGDNYIRKELFVSISRFPLGTKSYTKHLFKKSTEKTGVVDDFTINLKLCSSSIANLTIGLFARDSNNRLQACKKLASSMNGISSKDMTCVAEPLVFLALKDYSSEVRKEAAKAVRIMPSKVKIGFLLNGLQDKDPLVRLAASDFLATMSTSAAEPISSLNAPLVAALADSNAKIRANAAKALRFSEYNDFKVIEAVIDTLEDEDSAVRLAGIQSLSYIITRCKDKSALDSAIDGLIGALGDSESRIRVAAVKLLQDISGQDIADDQSQWQLWRSKRL